MALMPAGLLADHDRSTFEFCGTAREDRSDRGHGARATPEVIAARTLTSGRPHPTGGLSPQCLTEPLRYDPTSDRFQLHQLG